MVQLKAEDFELPNVAQKMKAVAKDVSLGRGFHLIKCVHGSLQTSPDSTPMSPLPASLCCI